MAPVASGSNPADAMAVCPCTHGHARRDRRRPRRQPDRARRRRDAEGAPPARARAARDAAVGDPPREHAEARARRRRDPAARARLLHAAADRSPTSSTSSSRACSISSASPHDARAALGRATARRAAGIASAPDVRVHRTSAPARPRARCRCSRCAPCCFPAACCRSRSSSSATSTWPRPASRDERPFGVCLITQGDEVARPARRPPGVRADRHARAHRRLGHAAARHPARRRPRAARASRCSAHRVAAGRPRRRRRVAARGRAARRRCPTSTQPLAELLELIAARIGPQNFPAERALRRRVVGRLPPRRAPAAAAVDQAEHARDQRRRQCGSRCCSDFLARAGPAAARPRRPAIIARL